MAVRLTSTQKSVVDHDEGALLVVAGPGSGKTRVLTERIRRLLARPNEHFRVLALTFTNKAANEMAERLSDVSQIAERGFIGTMHSFCVEVLANRGKSVGIDGLPHIFENYADRKQVLKEAAYNDIAAKRLLFSAGDAKDQNARLDSWMKGISDAKNALSVPAMVEDEDLRHIYELYDAAIRACGAIDFDDLLLLTYRVFEERPAIAAFYRRQFRYICVDEAQDLNEAQYRVLCALCGKDYFNVMMVGDPKQAIFTWNGADPKYLDLFQKDFKAKRIELRENFRSSKSVIAAAQALSPGYVAEEVFPIEGEVNCYVLPNEREEAAYVADQILSLIENGNKDVEGPITFERCAVLGRTKFVFGPIIEAFENKGITFYKKLSAANVESGSELITQFELALRVLANPLDRLHVAILARNWKAGSSADDVYEGLDLREINGMDVFNKLRTAARFDNAEIISKAIDALQWTEHNFKLVPALDLLEARSTGFDDESRNRVLQDLKEWRQHWNYFVRSEQGGSHSVGSFLSQVALGTTQQPNLEGVALLTVHSAKGMEFDVVFVIGLNEGTFPDYRARPGNTLEEERRNAFVAITRSKRLLYLTYPKVKMMPWGEEKEQNPSQFFGPILATLPKEAHE
jgi:DNA helicase-2/ATP-dependent DNA helicase PcrA